MKVAFGCWSLSYACWSRRVIMILRKSLRVWEGWPSRSFIMHCRWSSGKIIRRLIYWELIMDIQTLQISRDFFPYTCTGLVLKGYALTRWFSCNFVVQYIDVSVSLIWVFSWYFVARQSVSLRSKFLLRKPSSTTCAGLPHPPAYSYLPIFSEGTRIIPVAADKPTRGSDYLNIQSGVYKQPEYKASGDQAYSVEVIRGSPYQSR